MVSASSVCEEVVTYSQSRYCKTSKQRRRMMGDPEMDTRKLSHCRSTKNINHALLMPKAVILVYTSAFNVIGFWIVCCWVTQAIPELHSEPKGGK